MGVDLCSEDISICHCFPLNNAQTQRETRSSNGRQTMNPAIIIKFVRHKKHEEFYHAQNILQGKTVNDLNFNFKSGERMLVVESLTRANKELFNKTLQAKKGCHFNYIWTYQGKIFMRKDDSTDVIHVGCEKDIDSKIH